MYIPIKKWAMIITILCVAIELITNAGLVLLVILLAPLIWLAVLFDKALKRGKQ